MAVPSSTTYELEGIKYTIDRFSPPAAVVSAPVVVVLHGTDGMNGQSGPAIRAFAQQIADAGYAVFIPHYFNTADGADTQPIGELFERRLRQVHRYGPRVKAGLDHALRQNGIDRSCIGLIGLSLGGGLAVQYAESAGAAALRALVLFFPYVFDPTFYTNAGKLSPTLVLHNPADGFVDPRYSEQLITALKTSGVECRKEFLDDKNPAQKNHPFKPGGDADVKSRDLALEWLKDHLQSA